MGLMRVNTAYFEVVNTSDPDVVADGEAGENEWIARTAATVGPEATIVRVRALTRREFDAIPTTDDARMLGALVDAGVHDGDKALMSGPEPIPWHFQRTLGALIYRISTNPTPAPKSP